MLYVNFELWHYELIELWNLKYQLLDIMWSIICETPFIVNVMSFAYENPVWMYVNVWL